MHDVAHPDDLALARRAAAADAEAWDAVIQRFGTRIYNLTWRFAGGAAEAEDLTQEIFLKLYRNLHRYAGDVPLVALTLRLSRNLCIDHYRARRARGGWDQVSVAALEHLQGGDDPQARTVARDQLRVVEEVLRELPEALATIFLLRDVQEWAYDEIAAFLELPLGTVKSRLNRARRQLVSTLEKRLTAHGLATPTAALETSC